MSFLLPGALAALAALLVPILIHLSRRTHWQRVDFAALHWLQSRLRPRRRPVLEQWLLLLVRLLLLLGLVLLLAQPVHFRKPVAQHWLVVVPGADWQSLAGLPQGETLQRHWLAPGFPGIESAPPAGALALSSLLRELDAQLPENTRLTVVLPETLAGLDAERPRLSRAVDWRIAAGGMPAAAPPPPGVPVLAIRTDPGTAEAEAYFRAAYALWQQGLPASARQTLVVLADDAQTPPPGALWLDLRNAPISKNQRDWLARGGSLMLGPGTELPGAAGTARWRDARGEAVLVEQRLGRGRVLQWQRALDARTLPLLASGDFPVRLQQILQSHAPAPDRLAARDFQPARGVASRPAQPQPLVPWFALAVAVLFVVERVLASHGRRWGGA